VKPALRRFALAAWGVIKRFIANRPANQYEETIFNTIKTITFTFAKGLA
jgi:hypothetical protein